MRNIIAFVLAFLFCATAQAQGIKNPTYSKSRVVLADGLNSTGPLLPEDSNTVSHVYWSEDSRNFILQSGNLESATWNTLGSCSITPNTGPVGYTDLDTVDCAGPPSYQRQSVVAFPASTSTYTACATVAAVSGTVDAILWPLNTISSEPSTTMTCWRSDGGACQRNSPTGFYIKATGVTTTPVKVCAFVTKAAPVASTNFGLNTEGGLPFYAGRTIVIPNLVDDPVYVQTTTAAVTGALVETRPPSTLRTNYAPGLSTWVGVSAGSPLPTVTITNAQPDPFGGVEARRVAFAGNTDAANESALIRHATFQSVPVTGTYTYSIWMKTADGSTKTIPMSFWNGTSAYVVKPCTVTGDWTRFSSTGTITYSAGNILLAGVGWYNNAGAYAGGLTMVPSDIYIYGPQVEAGSVATEFIPSAGATSVPVFSGTTPLAWTQNGTVPQVAANVSPFVPGKAGAGPYSAANSYQGPTTLGEWQGDWSVSAVVNPSATGASVQMIAAKGTATNGWICYLNGTVASIGVYDGASKGANSVNTTQVNGPNVITCGKSGGTCYVRLNGGAAGSVACGTMTAASAEPIRIGRWGPATFQAATTTIYEILASTTPYSDALHASRFNAVFGLLPGPVTVTRADPIRYTANGFVWSAPPATMGVSASGSEVWKGATNSVLQSATACTGTAVTAPWTMPNATCIADQAVAPDGTTTMDEVTNSTNTGGFRQVTTTASGTTFTASVWVQHATSGPASQVIRCGAGAPTATACTCTRSDGGSCTAVISGDCIGYGTFTSTPVRFSVAATCPSAITDPNVFLAPGQFGGSTGTARFWGAQVEPGLYPTPYIPTAGTAVARAATTSSVPIPSLGERWCTSFTVSGQHGSWGSANWGFMASTNWGAANTFRIYYNPLHILVAQLTDAAGSSAVVSNQSVTAFPVTGSKRVTFCTTPTTWGKWWVDGSPLTVTQQDPGSYSLSGNMHLGAINGGSVQLDGSIKDVKFCKNATRYLECP